MWHMDDNVLKNEFLLGTEDTAIFHTNTKYSS